MKMNPAMRQIHRWLSIAFTMGVLIYITAMTLERPPAWLGVFPLLPLISLLVTGLYMFALPYVARSRAGRRVAGDKGFTGGLTGS